MTHVLADLTEFDIRAAQRWASRRGPGWSVETVNDGGTVWLTVHAPWANDALQAARTEAGFGARLPAPGPELRPDFRTIAAALDAGADVAEEDHQADQAEASAWDLECDIREQDDDARGLH